MLRSDSAEWLDPTLPTTGVVGKGYSICVAFLKLFEKVYAPLTAGLLAPFRGDRALTKEKRCTLDRLYQ